jgi:hypothetical protein
MKAIKTTIAAIALGGMAFATGVANAGSIEPPGWTAGVALGGPLPEGVYFINNASVAGWRGIDDTKSTLGIDIPLIAWSTPWALPGGGHIEFLGGWPAISGGIPQLPPAGDPSWAGRDYTQFYNPVGFVGAAWDLGGGFGFSAFIGGWAPIDNQLRQFGYDSWVLSERVNLAYSANGWKLAANLSFGQPGNTQTTPTILGTGQILPDYINYDLTATKTIGKWEAGLVAFGSADLSKAPWNGLAGHVVNGSPFGEQSQFAVGGLVGYAFTGLTVQLYATTDVASSNYYNLSDGSKSYETRVWTRAIVPLWNPPVLEPLK